MVNANVLIPHDVTWQCRTETYRIRSMLALLLIAMLASMLAQFHWHQDGVGSRVSAVRCNTFCFWLFIEWVDTHTHTRRESSRRDLSTQNISMRSEEHCVSQLRWPCFYLMKASGKHPRSHQAFYLPAHRTLSCYALPLLPSIHLKGIICTVFD